MRLIRAATLAPKPWKNGGGVTFDVAASPEGAGLDAFDWRISIAQVDRDGPFSAFPGIDRTLTIIDGVGMSLHFDEASASLMAGEPFSFPGDTPVDAKLASGGIIDFNVMTRRGRYDHRVSRIVGEIEIKPASHPRFLVSIAGARVLSGVKMVDAGPRDCVDLDGAAVNVATPLALLVEIFPQTA